MSITGVNTDKLATLPADLVLLIPMGAPLPKEVESIPVATGSFYERLGPLAVPSPGWHFVPCEVMEINDLSNSWERLVAARSIGYLTGLPGTVHDGLMDHVSITLGIKQYRWDDIAAELAEAIKAEQRASAAPPELSQPGNEPPEDVRAPGQKAFRSLNDRPRGSNLKVPEGDQDVGTE